MAADIGWVVAQARAAESATHTDRCTVTRADPASPGGWTEDVGDTVPAPITVAADLPCRLRAPSAADREAVAGEHQFAEGDAILRVDALTQGIRIGDTVTITSSPQGVALDRVFTVVWPIFGSHMSSARFVVRKVL